MLRTLYAVCPCLISEVQHKSLPQISGIKKYQCEFCGARFSDASTYRRHLKEKTSHPLSYICARCSTSFKRLNHLRNHIKKMHSDLIQSESLVPIAMVKHKDGNLKPVLNTDGKPVTTMQLLPSDNLDEPIHVIVPDSDPANPATAPQTVLIKDQPHEQEVHNQEITTTEESIPDPVLTEETQRILEQIQLNCVHNGGLDGLDGGAVQVAYHIIHDDDNQQIVEIQYQQLNSAGDDAGSVNIKEESVVAMQGESGFTAVAEGVTNLECAGTTATVEGMLSSENTGATSENAGVEGMDMELTGETATIEGASTSNSEQANITAAMDGTGGSDTAGMTASVEGIVTAENTGVSHVSVTLKQQATDHEQVHTNTASLQKLNWTVHGGGGDEPNIPSNGQSYTEPEYSRPYSEHTLQDSKHPVTEQGSQTNDLAQGTKTMSTSDNTGFPRTNSKFAEDSAVEATSANTEHVSHVHQNTTTDSPRNVLRSTGMTQAGYDSVQKSSIVQSAANFVPDMFKVASTNIVSHGAIQNPQSNLLHCDEDQAVIYEGTATVGEDSSGNNKPEEMAVSDLVQRGSDSNHSLAVQLYPEASHAVIAETQTMTPVTLPNQSQEMLNESSQMEVSNDPGPVLLLEEEAGSTMNPDFVNHPDFSSQEYYNWLSLFTEQCKQTPLPLSAQLFLDISQVNKTLAEVLATPSGIFAQKENYRALMKISHQLSAIASEHLVSMLEKLSENETS